MKARESVKAADRIRAAIQSEPRFRRQRDHLRVSVEDGIATLEGDVANVALKKLALERTAALADIDGIVDRLRVRPAQKMGDDEIRTRVRDALLQEPALVECAIREHDAGRIVTAREPDGFRGDISVSVEDGVVTLDGEVPSLARKRIAGVLAWWVPGTRDVVNGIGERFADEDPDAELTDAVQLVLEKDPFVDASQIRARVRDAVVLLLGLVPKEAERDMAEFDAWYVFGVDRVENRIEVRP